jgi:hypothetical protein
LPARNALENQETVSGFHQAFGASFAAIEECPKYLPAIRARNEAKIANRHDIVHMHAAQAAHALNNGDDVMTWLFLLPRFVVLNRKASASAEAWLCADSGVLPRNPFGLPVSTLKINWKSFRGN